jgi:integrase
MIGRKANGTPDRRSVYGRTRAEVVRKLDELRGRKASGLVTELTRLTVSDYLMQWLRDTVTMENRPGTFVRYEGNIRLHIAPAIGALKLTSLKPAHLQHVYAGMAARGFAPSTIRIVHAILHRALKRAVEWNYLPRNPADAVKPPSRTQPEMTPLTAEQVKQLLPAAVRASSRYAVLYRRLVDTGLRIGEALALAWPDVDLERGAVSITKTLQDVQRGGVPVLGDPKTEQSRRKVPLAPATVAALRAHRGRQNEERLQVGPGYAAYGFVFASPVGTAVYGRTVGVALTHLLASLGLPHVRLHDLRHTAATLMLEAGVPAKIVSERLGHSSIAMTLDRYLHVTEGMQRDAVRRVASMMGWD